MSSFRGPKYPRIWKTKKIIGTISKSQKLVNCVFADMEGLGIKSNTPIVSMAGKLFQKLGMLDKYDKLKKKYPPATWEYQYLKGKRVKIQLKDLKDFDDGSGKHLDYFENKHEDEIVMNLTRRV